MTAIWAARAAPGHRVVCLDGAARLGAKILIAGGGRCNVTHDVVDERAFAGGSPNAIRKVLRRFDVPETVAFFAELGVTLVREETGKLFPTTDRARTGLDALVGAAVTLGLRTATGKRLLELGGSLLCTHTGLSGPVVLDMSRHWRAAVTDDPSVELAVDWVPALGRDGLDALLLAPGSTGAVRRL